MGIRFICDACHKQLHVKGFLAGKRGVCPHCGAKVQIPAEEPAEANHHVGNGVALKETANGRSTSEPVEVPVIVTQSRRPAVSRTEAAPKISAAKTAAPIAARAVRRDPRNGDPVAKSLPQSGSQPYPQPDPEANAPQTAAEVAASTFGEALPDFQPAPQSTQPDVASPVPAQPLVSERAPVASGAPASSADTAAATPSQALASRPGSPVGPASNPIDESPGSSWYVQPPTGGQYGPARGEIMRKWIEEGRVSNDSLVWREGWDDWRLAGSVFSELAPVAAQPAVQPAASQPVVVPAVSAAVAKTPGAPAARARRRKSKRAAIAIFVGLVLVSLVLLGILLVVLLGK